MPNSDEVIAALSAHHAAMLELVASFGPDELRGPSACSEWDISEVLSHLGSAAVIGRGPLDASLSGEEVEIDNQAVWDRWNAMSADERAAEFVVADTALVGLFESLSPEQRSDLRIKLAFLPEPVDVGTVGGFRLNEVNLHRWDIEVMANPAATLDAASVGLQLASLPMFIGFVGKADKWTRGEASLLIELSEPASSFGLAIGESVSVTEAPAEPTGTVRLPAEAWTRLVFGRLAPAHTPAGIETEGEVELDDLRALFPGM